MVIDLPSRVGGVTATVAEEYDRRDWGGGEGHTVEKGGVGIDKDEGKLDKK